MMNIKDVPHNHEAEVAILGAMTLTPRAIRTACGLLSGEEFFDHRNRLIFEAVKTLHGQGKPVDLVTLAHEMTRADTLKRVGGSAYLAHLFEAEPTANHIKHHCEIVRDKALSRSLLEYGRELASRAMSGEPGAELLSWTRAEIGQLGQEHTPTRARSMEDFAKSGPDRVQEKKANPGLCGLSTGFRGLDGLTMGLKRDELIIIGARPSLGKSTISLQIASHVSKVHGPALFVSLEMSMQQLSDRLMSNFSRVGLSKIMTGAGLSDDEMLSIRDSMERRARLPLFVARMHGPSLAQVQRRVEALHERHGLRLAVVDFLQLMKEPGQHSREQEIGSIATGLKAMGGRLGIPILCLSQLSRGVENRPDKKPRLADLRDSGQIEQAGDQVWLLHKPKPQAQNPTVEVLVRKNRQGPTGRTKLIFMPEMVRFDNPEWRQPYA